ncbi:MAG: site-specific integrase [Oscillospiraceae bacterium]
MIPAEGLQAAAQKARGMQVLARDELQRFLIRAQAEVTMELFSAGLATGLRRGELLALQWDDLDFETGVLTIRQAGKPRPGKIVMSVPKTKSSIRKLVLPPAVVQVLKEYRESVHSRWMFPSPVLGGSAAQPRFGLRPIAADSGARKLQTGAFYDPRHTSRPWRCKMGWT